MSALTRADEFVEELLVNIFVHRHAAGGGAALARGAKAAPHRAFDREVQIGVFEHDQYIFAAHFEMAGLEGRRGGFRDDAADFR